MAQCDRASTGPDGRGRGTGKTILFPPDRIKSEKEEEEELIGGYTETGCFAVPRPLPIDADLTAFLAANPAMTARDYKGKGFTEFAPFDKHHVEPGEVAWDKLSRAEVRRLATSDKARFLPRNVRMAAAHDPGLIWCDRSRSYRLASAATPAPPEASSGHADREGGRKVSGSPAFRPAAATNKTANRHFPEGDNG